MLGFVLRSLFATLGRRVRGGPLRPGWSFGFEVIVGMLRRDMDSSWRWPIARLRAGMARRPVVKRYTKRVTVRPDASGPVPGTWFEPPGARDDRVLCYLHGGSYHFGDARSHGDVAARLGVHGNLRVFLPEYRLAPEHPHPAQLEDGLATLAWLEGQGARVALAGESAGGSLAVAMMIARRDGGGAQPACAAVMSPWVDLAATTDAYTRNAPYDYGGREMLLAQARAFAGERALDDPAVSPIHADLSGLAPTLVQWGTAEILADDCAAYARHAEAAGSPVTADPVPEMPHACWLLAEYAAAGQAAITRAAAFLAEAGEG